MSKQHNDSSSAPGLVAFALASQYRPAHLRIPDLSGGPLTCPGAVAYLYSRAGDTSSSYRPLRPGEQLPNDQYVVITGLNATIYRQK
jgi:hypothetical protein